MRRAKLLCLVLGDEDGGGPEVLSLMGSIPLMREAIEEIRGDHCLFSSHRRGLGGLESGQFI